MKSVHCDLLLRRNADHLKVTKVPEKSAGSVEKMEKVGKVAGTSKTESDRSNWDFATLLDWHLRRGTGREGKLGPWADKDFAKAIDEGVDRKTVQNWRGGRNLPIEIYSILRVLFGTDRHAEYEAELIAAYDKAKALRSRRPESPDQPGRPCQVQAALPGTNVSTATGRRTASDSGGTNATFVTGDIVVHIEAPSAAVDNFLQRTHRAERSSHRNAHVTPQNEFRLFLSAVPGEFGKARDALGADLRSRELQLRVQSDFRQEAGSDTILKKLHDCISECSAVVCIMGKHSGDLPPPAAAEPFKHMLPPGMATASYSQWEFVFARHFRRRLAIYIANDDYQAGRAPPRDDDLELQRAFIAHIINEQGLDRSYFSNEDQLCRAVLKEDWAKAVGRRRSSAIPTEYGDETNIGKIETSKADTSSRLRLQRNAISALAPLPLVSDYLPMSNKIADLKAILLKADGLSGDHRLGLHGVAGIGKTSLAADLAADQDVRNRFTNVLWLTFGRSVDLKREQIRLAAALGDDSFDSNTIDEARRWFAHLTKDVAALVILDDVWEPDHAKAFSGIGGRSRLVVTTRNRAVLDAADAMEYPVRQLTLEEGRALLAKRLHVDPSKLPHDVNAVVRECGFLPLPLAAAAALVKSGSHSWKKIHTLFQRADIGRIRAVLPDYNEESVLKALDISVNALSQRKQQAFRRCAVFAEDADVPESALERLWSDLFPNPLDAGDLAREFYDRTLLTRSDAHPYTIDPDRRLYRVHDLYFDYLRGTTQELTARVMHTYLIQAYRELCQNGLESGPNDGYFLEFLPFHLHAAGKQEELDRLLFEPDWLVRKIRTVSLTAVQADLSYSSNIEAVFALGRVLTQMRHIVSRRPEQLLPQLMARIGPGMPDAVIALRQKLSPRLDDSNLRPKRASLQRDLRLAFTLRGHHDEVSHVAVTFDGQLAVSASSDGLKVWDLTNGTLLNTLQREWATCVVLIPHVYQAVSGSTDGTLRVWDLNTYALVRTLHGHKKKWMQSIVLTADGRRAVSTYEDDQAVTVWDLLGGTVLHTMHNAKPVTDVALTADDRWVVSTSKDTTLRIWDLNTGTLQRVLSGHRDWLRGVALTSDGRRAVTYSIDKTLKVWDLETGALLHTLEGHTNWIDVVALTDDGRQAISGSQDRTLKVWDLTTGSLLRTLSGHRARVLAVVITPDGRRAVSASDDNSLKMWDLTTGTCLYSLDGHDQEVRSVALTPDGRRAVSGSVDKTLKVWDLDIGSHSPILQSHTDEVKAVALSTDGRRAVSASGDTTLKVWDLETGALIHSLEGHTQSINAVALMSDSRRAVSASDDTTLKVWDLETGALIHTLEGHTQSINAVVLTSEGRRAVSASEDKTLKLWNLDASTLVHSFGPHERQVLAFALVPDGQRVVSADGRTRVWDLDTGAQLVELSDSHWEGPLAATLDGQRVVLGPILDLPTIWDLDTGAKLQTLWEAEPQDTVSILILPDKRRAILACLWGGLRMWDLDTGTLLDTVDGHESWVTGAALSADGRWAVSCSDDKTLVVWRLEACALHREAEFTVDTRINSIGITVSSNNKEYVIVAGDHAGNVHILQFVPHDPS